MSSGKVKCTCGWSWNKSDSSKKDMYICHECGRDNSNNMKNGGWLDNYGEEDNYNESEASAPEGMEGDGFSNVGRNYSPAWGGQFQLGGNVYPVNYVPQAQEGKELTFLQPTSEKLPQGYRFPYSDPSSERAMSIGGENGEPAYLIPSFKYGQPLYDPIGEFKKTKEHLGGPFKTWQEADKWENETRHPAVEKGENIMFPQEQFQMGGTIAGAVGFSYARTQGAAPSNGKYAKKTMASAQNGKEMQYYQNGLDWQPKSISRDGSVIKDDRGQWDHPGEVTEINSNQITMGPDPKTGKPLTRPLVGVSDTGDVKIMHPGKDYKFKGNKVTEYPIAQNGKTQGNKIYDFSGGRVGDMKQFIINEVNKDKKTKVDVNPSKKDNTYVNKNKKEDLNFLTKQQSQVKKSVQDQMDFTKGWMDSPMYKQMVDNSTTGIVDEYYLNQNRENNFNDVNIVTSGAGRQGVGADSNSTTGLIRLFPTGYNSPGLEGIVAHEASHSSDKPVNEFSKFQRLVDDPYSHGERNIPKRDIDLMQSYSKGSESYKNLFNSSALKDKELNEDRKWHNYITTPTETRARLNDIRYNAKKYNIYDPYTQKVNAKQIRQIRDLTKKAEGFDPFEQLHGVYNTKQIMNMLNSISQNDDTSKPIPIAKDGLRQEQKGLQNLDNLTNFTNYNKPQPGGWLNKYN